MGVMKMEDGADEALYVNERVAPECSKADDSTIGTWDYGQHEVMLCI